MRYIRVETECEWGVIFRTENAAAALESGGRTRWTDRDEAYAVAAEEFSSRLPADARRSDRIAVDEARGLFSFRSRKAGSYTVELVPFVVR